MRIKRKWHWRFANQKQTLPVDPADLTPEDLVRSFDGREVYRKSGYYLKFYLDEPDTFLQRVQMFLNSAARKEYVRLLRLQKKQLSAVIPVAYGKCGTSSVLITKEAENTHSVLDILLDLIDRRQLIPQDFLQNWAEFVKKIIDARIYFSDFHSGNLLCDEVQKRFIIVDPFDIKFPLFLRRSRLLRMLKRQFSIMFEFGTKADLIAICSVIAPDAPEQLYHDLMVYSAGYVQHRQLSKRLRCFRKQNHIKNGIQRRFSPDLRWYPLDNTEVRELSMETVQTVWERDYICSLYRIPMLHTVGRVPGSGKIYQQKAGEKPADPSIVCELQERLKICRLEPENFDFCTDLAGRTVLVDRLTRQER